MRSLSTIRRKLLTVLSDKRVAWFTDSFNFIFVVLLYIVIRVCMYAQTIGIDASVWKGVLVVIVLYIVVRGYLIRLFNNR